MHTKISLVLLHRISKYKLELFIKQGINDQKKQCLFLLNLNWRFLIHLEIKKLKHGKFKELEQFVKISRAIEKRLKIVAFSYWSYRLI